MLHLDENIENQQEPTFTDIVGIAVNDLCVSDFSDNTISVNACNTASDIYGITENELRRIISDLIDEKLKNINAAS